MQETLGRSRAVGLEGLCGAAGADRRARPRIRMGCPAPGIERLEAHLFGQAYSPHRHDVYAIGVTLSGAHLFGYRGERRVCDPGHGHVLHPDEVHDGGAGTEEGFGYRIMYVDPALIQAALGGRPLPFVADPVVRPADLAPAFVASLADLDAPIGEVERVEVAVAVADMLEGLAAPTRRGSRAAPLHVEAMSRVRALIADDPAVAHSAEGLERAAGLDRWTVARQFRAVFGTSPSRFRTMRRLDQARRMIGEGMPLCDAALAAGFADQSHMSRLFRGTWGLTPGRWSALAGQRDAGRPEPVEQRR